MNRSFFHDGGGLGGVSTDLQGHFAEPPVSFRPTTFWSWNERLEPEEIRWQAGELAAAGLGGGFIHSREGLLTPYLGEEWFASVKAAVEESERIGLKAWLYDEDRWPSGFGGGRVARGSVDFRMRVLFALPEETQAPDGAVRRGPASQGLAVYEITSPMGQAYYNGACYADTLNPDAVDCFLREAYAPYRERFGDKFGTVIPGAFTDEPSAIDLRSQIPLPAVPFSPVLQEYFRERHGENLDGSLAMLFVDAPGAGAFRIRYYDAVTSLFGSNYVGRIDRWCRQNGFFLTGHFMAEDNLIGQHRWGGRVMPLYAAMSLPGIDCLRREVTDVLSAKQCQSAVNQFRKPRMLSEAFGAGGQNLTFADRHWIAAQQLALGVNFFCHHLSLYSMAGCRKRDYPPVIGWQQPWWAVNRMADEPLSRSCLALGQGSFLPELLVLHPLRSMAALWQMPPAELDTDSDRLFVTAAGDEAGEMLRRIERDFARITGELLAHQRLFDFGDEGQFIELGRIEGDPPLLRLGEMLYPAVLVPSMDSLSEATFEILREFARRGGQILCAGIKPSKIDGNPSKELEEWERTIPGCEPDSLGRRLEELLPPMVRIHGLDEEVRRAVVVHLRALPGDGRLLFLANLHREKGGEAGIVVRGKSSGIELLDTGSGRILDVLPGKVSLAPNQSLLLRIGETPGTQVSGTTVLQRGSPESIVPIPPDRWTVRALDSNALVLDRAFFRFGAGAWSKNSAPVVGIHELLKARDHRGPVSLRFEFDLRFLPAELGLVVERPESVCVKVNGHSVSGWKRWIDRDFLKADIVGIAREGRNEVVVEFAEFIPPLPAETGPARFGTELESVYLTGNFALEGPVRAWDGPLPEAGPFGKFPEEVLGQSGDGLALREQGKLEFGDITKQGFPFYAGRLQFQTTLPEMDLEGGFLLMEFERLDAVAGEASLGSERVGSLISAPCRIDLTGPYRFGARELSVTLYGSLRNLLGPHHHPLGELRAVDPLSFLPLELRNWWNRSEGGSVSNQVVEDWVLRNSTLEGWRSDYCVVGFGNLGNARLLVTKEPVFPAVRPATPREIGTMPIGRISRWS